MNKHKVVNNIQVNWDFVLASADNGIIMGEATWLTTEELQLLEGELMTYDPLDTNELPSFQAKIDEAVSIVFGRAASVAGVRFSKEAIVIHMHLNETVDDSMFLPYVCLRGSTELVVGFIHDILTDREREIQKKEKYRKDYEEKHERDIYERLRKKFEKVE